MGNEYDKKYTWLIKNFSSLRSEKIYSSKFVAGGCNWCFLAFPRGTKGTNCLSLYLDFVNSESLCSGWRRHVKFRLTIVNQLYKTGSRQREIQSWFAENNTNWGFDSFVPLAELHVKDGGFLVNGEIMVIAELNVLEVIGNLDVSEETSPVMESMDVNGFHVLSSQVESVKRLFESHPNIASNLRIQNQLLKTAYMTLLLNLLNTLSTSALDISRDDIADASSAIVSLKVAGFELDWLEMKLEGVKRCKERVVPIEIRLNKIDEKMKEFEDSFSDLPGLLEELKAERLARNASTSLRI